MIQCQEFEILFIPFISASILIICCAYINYVQSYAIICKIYPFCPFFFIFAAFLGKNRDHRRVFCHSKQLVLRPFAHRPLAQKLRNPCLDDLRHWRKFVADILRLLCHILRSAHHIVLHILTLSPPTITPGTPAGVKGWQPEPSLPSCRGGKEMRRDDGEIKYV